LTRRVARRMTTLGPRHPPFETPQPSRRLGDLAETRALEPVSRATPRLITSPKRIGSSRKMECDEGPSWCSYRRRTSESRRRKRPPEPPMRAIASASHPYDLGRRVLQHPRTRADGPATCRASSARIEHWQDQLPGRSWTASPPTTARVIAPFRLSSSGQYDRRGCYFFRNPSFVSLRRISPQNGYSSVREAESAHRPEDSRRCAFARFLLPVHASAKCCAQHSEN
jgi:hypothetical protein